MGRPGTYHGHLIPQTDELKVCHIFSNFIDCYQGNEIRNL